jgi:hypothetical protein
MEWVGDEKLSKKDKLQKLQQLISPYEDVARLKGSVYQQSFFPFSKVRKGIPKGALSEISGKGKSRLLISFLSENPDLQVVWIEPEISVFPQAMAQRGLDLKRYLFVESGQETDWTLLQVLKSQVFQIVVLSDYFPSEGQLKKIHYFSKKSSSAVIFLSKHPHSHWTLSFQVEVESHNKKEKNVHLLKQKAGLL